MKNGRKLMTLALAGLMTFSLAGCGSKTTGASGDADSKDSAEIKVGGNFELSGDVSTYGNSVMNSIKLAFDEINAKGGVLGKKLVLVERDNKSDTTESTSISTSLVGDPSIVALIGPATSGTTMAASQPATDNKIPLLTPTATNPNVTVDPNTGKVKEYIFRSCFLDSFQGQATAKFAVEDLKAKKAAILVDNKSEYSKGLAKAFEETFTKAGGTVIGTEAFLSEENDFRAILTRVRSQQPDVIFVPAYYNAAGKIVKQARELGVNVPLIGSDGWDSPQLVEIAGAKTLNNTYFINHYTTEDPDERIQAFVKAYKAKHNQTPDALAALAYDGAYILADAIKTSGDASPEKIKEALANIKDFPGITGVVTLDENHNPIKSAVIIEMKDGKQTINKKVQP